MSWSKSYQPVGPAKFSQNGWYPTSTIKPPKPKSNMVFVLFWMTIIINSVIILALQF